MKVLSPWLYFDAGILTFVVLTALRGVWLTGFAFPTLVWLGGPWFVYVAYPSALLLYAGFMLLVMPKRPLLAPFLTLMAIAVSELGYNGAAFVILGVVLPTSWYLPLVWVAWVALAWLVLRWQRVGLKRDWVLPLWLVQVSLVVAFLPGWAQPSIPGMTLLQAFYMAFNEGLCCLGVWRTLALSPGAPPESRSSSASSL